MRDISSFKARLEDKKELIESHLAQFPPTIVISKTEGIYVFAHRVARVHSTIVLAGAGQSFNSIENWLREQFNFLVVNFAPNVPKASKDIKFFPDIFSINLDASEHARYADLVLIEVGADPESDYVAQVDFLGNVSEVEIENDFEIISYKNRLPKDAAEDRTEDKEGEEEREERLKEYRDKMLQELISLGINPELFEEGGDFRELLEQLKRAYEGNCGFLDREKLRAKEFSWIYRTL